VLVFRVPYSYSTRVDWRKYDEVIVAPVAIYRGPDAQFQKVSEEKKTALAQFIRGKEGMMMGSVSYAVEIYDASNDRLLCAYVEKQYPNAMNVGSTFGGLSASKTGIRKGADALLEQLN
jgi:hypothetical protein